MTESEQIQHIFLQGLILGATFRFTWWMLRLAYTALSSRTSQDID